MTRADAKKRLIVIVPLMKCGNRLEFQQRLQWLSEGMLGNLMGNTGNHTPDQEEINAYKAYKEELK